MTHPITLTPTDARTLHETGRLVQGMRMDPQPRHVQRLNNGTFESSHDGGFDQDVIVLVCPWGAMGDEWWGQEPWKLTGRSLRDGRCTVKYKAGGIRHSHQIMDRHFVKMVNITVRDRWNLPEVLPHWLSRFTGAQTISVEQGAAGWEWVRVLTVKR